MKNETPSELAARLRRDAGLRLSDLSKETGISEGHLSLIEGGYKVSAAVAIKLAQYWKRPLEDFYPDAAGVLTRAACQ
jgi:transcriptional regulator with XRE-family HTH domain